jgi:hypothetical protein
LWAAIGGSIGSLNEQQILAAANWSQFKAGAVIAELEALFPRIETTEEEK